MDGLKVIPCDWSGKALNGARNSTCSPVKRPHSLTALQEPSRTIVRLASTTGMRRGEIFGLKWEDIDLTSACVRIVRSIVDQVAGDPKTVGSRRETPLDDGTVAALKEWRSASDFTEERDGVFASSVQLERAPLWPNTVLERHVKPVASSVGITKKVGWHTFRRSFPTLLQATSGNVKVVQELLGHSSPLMTLGTYAKAIADDKREVQASMAALFDLPVLNGPKWPHTEALGPELKR